MDGRAKEQATGHGCRARDPNGKAKEGKKKEAKDKNVESYTQPKMKRRDQVEQQLRDPPGTRILRIEGIVCGHLVTRTTTKAQKEERKEKATEAN